MNLELIPTHDLLSEINERLGHVESSDLNYIKLIKKAGLNIDQTTSGEATTGSIDQALNKISNEGYIPHYIIIPVSQQHHIRDDHKFHEAVKKYITEGVIGHYIGCTVIVTKDENLKNRYGDKKTKYNYKALVAGQKLDENAPEKSLCTIQLW